MHQLWLDKHSCVTADLILTPWSPAAERLLRPASLYAGAAIRWANSQLNVSWNTALTHVSVSALLISLASTRPVKCHSLLPHWSCAGAALGREHAEQAEFKCCMHANNNDVCVFVHRCAEQEQTRVARCHLLERLCIDYLSLMWAIVGVLVRMHHFKWKLMLHRVSLRFYWL